MTNSKIQKTINLTAILLGFIFAFLIVFCYNHINNTILFKEQLFNQITYNTNHQNYIIKSLTEANKPSSEEEKPLFKNSKEAIIIATNNLKMRETFYMKSLGTVITDAGLKVVVKSDQETWKFSQTEMYKLVEKLQTKGLDMGQTNATLTYTVNNKTYKKTTNSVSESGNNLNSNFNTSWKESSLESTTILHYNFNQNTIINETDLIVYYNADGTISHYVTEFNLSTTIGIQEYANVIKNNTDGKAKTPPTFSVIKMRMEIDREGNVSKLYSYEVCSMNVGLNATVTNEFHYEFYSLENAPKLTKPNIP